MTRMDTGHTFAQAREAMVQGRADLAIKSLRELLRIAPGNAPAWQLFGFACRDEQQMSEAIAAFARAQELDHTNDLTAAALAQTRLESGLAAVEDCRRALALRPGSEPLIASLAAALVAEGRRGEADAVLADALARHADWFEGQRQLATIRWTGGDRVGYARGYAAGCRVQPQNLALRLAWFRLVAQVRDWPAARAILDEGERLFGPQRAFVIARLFIAGESGARAEVEELFERTREWRDEVRDLAWIRHCLRERRPVEAADIALGLTRTPSARLAWPYLSLIWRLLDDPRARWLDGSPPYVRAFDVQLERAHLEELAELLRRLHTARAPYIEQSVRGGTQTERPVFFRTEPILQLARARILDALREYVAGLPPFEAGHPLLGTPRTQLLFSGSWSVRLLRGGFNVAHTHPLGWISSAFYVSLPDAAQMGPKPAGWIRFGEAPPELGLDLPYVAEVEPRVGRLVLFPSTMWHGTVPFNDGERLALAFDVRAPAY
jgi:tetratricopeptide (TPR) repeat protein